MSTTLVQWGNSDAIRIPKTLLQRAGLKRGDCVEIELNTAGHLELLPVEKAHRCVQPSRKINADDLLCAYQGNRFDNRDAWSSDELLGAEQEAWQP
ncbi:MAG: AbrB/MazE/SpoVT family DNA-binding domain-containing protein [Eggerthellaceae bacterium]|nr:AbrB/MazE/SpoVT family DNA-binding domain-containing protein [Eggerthellaceae bacterium]